MIKTDDTKPLIVPSTRNASQGVPIPDDHYTELMQAIIDREGGDVTDEFLEDLSSSLAKIIHRTRPKSTVTAKRNPDVEGGVTIVFREDVNGQEFAVIPFSEFNALQGAQGPSPAPETEPSAKD